MRRFQALLIAAGLAATPASVVASPSNDPRSTPQTFEKFELLHPEKPHETSLRS